MSATRSGTPKQSRFVILENLKTMLTLQARFI
jgi:hypothetical protein